MDFSAATRQVAPGVQAMVAGAGLLPAGGYGAYDRPAVAFVGTSAGAGWNNIKPRARAERRHLINRDAVEKDRLRDRREKHANYAEPGALLAPDGPDNGLYASDADRFFTDVAAEQRHLRQEAIQKKQAETIRRREEGLQREEKRWFDMEAEARAFQEKTVALQGQESKSMKNKSGQPFNPVTQEYKEGDAGAVLRYADERTKWRAGVRAEFLSEHSAGSTFNPLTGEDTAGAGKYKAGPPPRPDDVGLRGVSAEQALAMSRRYR